MENREDKNRFVDKKIDEYIGAKAEVIGNLIGIFLVGGLAIGAVTFPTALLANIIVEMKTIGILLDALIVPVTGFYAADKISDIKEINKRLTHLEGIKKNGIKSNREYDKKRLERIDELEDEEGNKYRKLLVLITFSIIAAIASFITGCGSLLKVAYPIIPYISAASTLGLTGLLIKTAKCQNEMKSLETRIANLKESIELGSVNGYNPSIVKQKDSKQEEIETKGLTKEETNDIIKAAGYSKEEILEVENYINNLVNTIEEENSKVFKKVKEI